VEENMSFFGGIYGLDSSLSRKRIEEVLRLTGLMDRRNSMTGDLPGGLKQRLALGCALLHEPPIIFLDEPTSGVDPGTRRNFWDLIYTLADRGVTVFVTTHYMEEAEYCNRIALIDRGRLIALGSPEELKRKHLEGAIYEVEMEDALHGSETLAGMEEILDAAVFGRSLHVRIREMEAPETFLSLSLRRAGLIPERIQRIEPSLEDVFVALVGRTPE
jgi:ABC-2 type transport system ATP-binding protein